MIETLMPSAQKMTVALSIAESLSAQWRNFGSCEMSKTSSWNTVNNILASKGALKPVDVAKHSYYNSTRLGENSVIKPS